MTFQADYLRLFLRLSAVMFLSAIGAVVMPTSWMARIHEGLGLGVLPDVPLMEYLTRTVSALYAALGASYWFLSCDLRRYLPLLRFNVWVSWVLDVAIVAVDLVAGMPLAWLVIEAVCVFGWTLALWWLVRGVEVAD